MAENRYKKRHRKRISVNFGIERVEKFGFTDDINHGGLFIRSAVVVKPGVTIRVEIKQPQGLIVQFGGQTPLKLARALEAAGAPIVGTSPTSIHQAEDRERSKALRASSFSGARYSGAGAYFAKSGARSRTPTSPARMP